MAATSQRAVRQSNPAATAECLLWRLPDEILDIIFELYFTNSGRSDDCQMLHINKLLYMFTTLPPRDRPSPEHEDLGWGYMGWDRKFPQLLTVSTRWCHKALRAWLRTRELFLSLAHLEYDDFDRFHPKTWLLFRDVSFAIDGHSQAHRYFSPRSTWNVKDGLQCIFENCINVTHFEFENCDELLDFGFTAHFPGEYEDDYGVSELDLEHLFGGIDWMETLLRNKSLKTFACPSGEYCNMNYGGGRDYSDFPTYPSAEMSGALEALEVYVYGKLQARDAERDNHDNSVVAENAVHGDTVSK